MQLVFQSMLGQGASQHVLPTFVIAHQSSLLRFRAPSNQSPLVLSWTPPSSAFTAMVDVPAITKSNVLRGLCLFQEPPQLQTNPASEKADVKVTPNGAKHILATTPNSHVDILTPKWVIVNRGRRNHFTGPTSNFINQSVPGEQDTQLNCVE